MNLEWVKQALDEQHKFELLRYMYLVDGVLMASNSHVFFCAPFNIGLKGSVVLHGNMDLKALHPPEYVERMLEVWNGGVDRCRFIAGEYDLDSVHPSPDDDGKVIGLPGGVWVKERYWKAACKHGEPDSLMYSPGRTLYLCWEDGRQAIIMGVEHD